MKTSIRMSLLVLLTALTVATAGCLGSGTNGDVLRGDTSTGTSDDTGDTGDTGDAVGGGGGASGDAGDETILMENLKFSPAEITVPVGTTITWTNNEAIGHTVTPTDKEAWGTEGSGDASNDWLMEGESWSFTFTEEGTFDYICLPHAFQGSDGQYQGMVGKVVVTAAGGGAGGGDGGGDAFQLPDESVVPDPVAPAVKEPDEDGIVRFTLETKEVTAELSDDAAFTFWTFDGTVPGPMLRVREGDTVELTLTNAEDSTMTHNIDLHAVTGPGGGAEATLVAPGESKTFRFKALHPGAFVYHCATPPVPAHVANGMYGLIVVEPEGGYEPVDHEYYVVQGETYTNEAVGSAGHLTFSPAKLLSEDPEFIHFNGRVGALTGDGALTAEVGDSVRIFFAVGGFVPSSFHVIGEVFDKVFMDGNGPATENRQTIMVPAAGAAVVEFDVNYPGTYVLVDHTLTRAIDRGAAGHLVVTGEEDPEVFRAME